LYPTGVPQPASEPPSVANRRSLDSRRLLARLIDALVIFGATMVVRLLVGPVSWGGWLAALWIGVAYFFLCEAFTGQTLGKRWMGLRVLRRDGTPPSANSVAARNVIRILEEPILALLFMVGTGRRRQRIGDLFGSTVVGRAEGSGRPARSPLLLVYPVIWAAGALCFGLVVQPPISKPNSYPPADSLAGEMTPAWRAFAYEVDRACATNFNDGQRELAALDAQVETHGMSTNQAEAAYRFIQAEHQQRTYDAIAALGQPPAKPRLFSRWLANVGRRAELMRQTGRAWLQGDRRLTQVRSLRIIALKIDADWLGQHFGLRICTSNGPSQNRDEDEDYREQLNDVCLDRTAQDHALWRRGKFTPNAAAGTSTGETLRMAAVAPPTEQYGLRRRILEVKRAIDRDQVRTIRRAAQDPGPNAWTRVSKGLGARIIRGRERLAALGLPGCAWPKQWR
jgi:uncharacterized RDD family membrane protein YckC